MHLPFRLLLSFVFFPVSFLPGQVAELASQDAWSIRPHLRFTPPSGWMNDPNGLISLSDADGRAVHHLFYQYEWPRSWGHARSRDFIHWEHLPVALKPDGTGDCWSGSVVQRPVAGDLEDRPELVAVYTAWKPADQSQQQALAVSRDQGLSWAQHPANPVLTPPAGTPDFRDPKVVWQAGSQSWLMALACGRSLRFYRSPDLVDWKPVGEFAVTPPGPDTTVWECPDLLEVQVEGESETVWLLICSYLDSAIFKESERRDGQSGVWVFTGDCSPEGFVSNDSGRSFSQGLDDYATIAWPGDGPRPPAAIGWMNHWAYAERVPTSPWQGMLTLPRVVTAHRRANGRIEVMQAPLPDLSERLGRQLPLDALSLPAQVSLQPSPAFEQATVAFYPVSTHPKEEPLIYLALEAEPSGQCRLRLVRPPLEGLPPHFARSAEMVVDLSQLATQPIRIFLDGGGIEIFAGGRYMNALCPLARVNSLEVRGDHLQARAHQILAPGKTTKSAH